MNKTMSVKEILRSSILFVGLIAITFFILFKDNSIENIMESLKNVNLIYVFLGMVCMFIFICCEGINIKGIKIFICRIFL